MMFPTPDYVDAYQEELRKSARTTIWVDQMPVDIPVLAPWDGLRFHLRNLLISLGKRLKNGSSYVKLFGKCA